MKFLPIRVTTTGGVAVTGLVKANVVLKKWDDPSTIYDYTSLYEVGYGQYVLVGCRDGLTLAYCKLYINDVEQDWLNILLLGDEFVTFILRAGDAGILGLLAYSTDLTITGDKTLPHKKYVDTADALKQNIVSGVSDTEIGYLDGVTSGIQGQINNRLRIDSEAQTVAGVKTFSGNNIHSGNNTFSGGNTHSGGSTFSGDALFSYGEPPRIAAAPVRATSAANKSYVDSEITNRINSFAPGTFQESQNIIRIIPNGTPETDKVYATWATALANAISRSPSATKQFTLLLTGEGTSASDFDITAYEVSSGVFKFMVDYVHLRGLGADMKCTFAQGNILSTEWEAGALGRIVVEDIFFCDDDSDVGNTGEFKNIIFKNCKFDIRTGIQLTFTNCKFEGNCEFVSYADTQFTFTNCTGSPITIDNHTVSVGGTNKIPFVGTALAKYHTPLEVTGNLILTDFGNVKPTKASITVSEAFGVVANGIVLGEPVEWAQVTFNGVEYTLPLYLPDV